MKLTEALKILNAYRNSEAQSFPVSLACGFTPLHLQTFFAAELQGALPARKVEIVTGLYGDLAGSVAMLANADVRGAAVLLEWPDLDARLGYRRLGGWSASQFEDILLNARAVLRTLAGSLRAAAVRFPVALSLPTLRMPPLGFMAGWQSGPFEFELRRLVAEFAAQLSEQRGIRLLNEDTLNSTSNPSERFDMKSELSTGFSYTNGHASAMASLLARLIQPPAAKKGIITDLDDTLWLGLVGETGPADVCWDLDRHAQIHGLYQQTLQALADAGVLVAIASKNDATVAEEALRRDDLLLRKESVFPIEIHWNAKSESVTRILRKWNIGADSVVFVDDSPIELAEVKAAHPDVECILFPKNEPTEALRLLQRLKDLFGKTAVSSDDAVRLASLRAAEEFQAGAGETTADTDAFLASAQGVMAVSFQKLPVDTRVFELVNKTNQFNLNGIRCAEGEWRGRLEDSSSFLMAIGYRDKFGPLGTIAAVQGRIDGDTLLIDMWVMSCRAFARRIEYKTLALLFESFHANTARLEYRPTAKNGPTRDFLRSLLDAAPEGPVEIPRALFEQKCPALFQAVELTGAEPALANA